MKNSAGTFERDRLRDRAERNTVYPKYLFVYGTLRQSHAPPKMARVMQRLEWVGKGTVPGRIYDLGEYPGAVFDKNSGSKIQGEVYKLPADEKVLSSLDAYEEFRPDRPDESLFVRVSIPVLVETGKRLKCWAYRFNSKQPKKRASRRLKGRGSQAKSRSATH